MALFTVLSALLLTLLIHNVGVNATLPVTDVRLMYHGVDTTSFGLGRVEVLVAGSWGAICDDGWDDADASVVCSMIGMPGLNPKPAVRTTMFGLTTSPYLYEMVNCTVVPSPTNLSDCSADPSLRCTPSEPAGVMCNTSNPFELYCGPNLRLLRLPGVPEGMGMVEYRNTSNSTWGGVCDDYWDTMDAAVVCRMCGLPTVNPRPEGEGLTGASTAPYIIDDVECLGTETDLSACPLSYTHNCGPQERASVTCVHLNNTGQDPPRPEMDCSNDVMTVSFDLTRHPSLTFFHLIVNPPSGCSSATNASNGTHISVRIPMRQCNMSMIQNATHIIYSNTIGYNSTNTTGFLAFTNTYVINVRCELNRTANLSRRYEPEEGVVNASATSAYNLTMRFFLNDSFTIEDTRQPLPIPIGHNLNVAINMARSYQDTELVVHNCWVTPTSPSTSTIYSALMTEKCRSDPTLRIFPLNHTMFGFRFQTFNFVSSNTIYVNCDAFVCIRRLGIYDCDQSCDRTKPTASYPISAPGRRKRAVSSRPETVTVTSPPVNLYEPGQAILTQSGNDVTAAPERTTQRSATPTGKQPNVHWQWAPAQPGSASQTKEATSDGKVKGEGEGGSAASQGNSRLPSQSQVLILQSSSGAARGTRSAAAMAVGLLSLLIWVVLS